MANYYSGTEKRCASCENWGGKRTLDQARTHACVQSQSDKGECLIHAYNTPMTGAGYNCPKWKKWGVLK